jgi:hypothetical protein
VNKTAPSPQALSMRAPWIGPLIAGAAIALLAACSSTAAGSSGTQPTGVTLTVHGPSAHPSRSADSPAKAAPKPSPTATPAPSYSTSQLPAASADGAGSTDALKLNAGFPSPSTSAPRHAAPAASPPTPTGPVTYVSYAYVRPYNCREHAYFVDTAADVSTAVDVTVELDGVPADSLSIVAPTRAVPTLPDASTLVSSKSLGHGLYEATYETYVSLFHPNFTPVTVSSLTAVSASDTQYTFAISSPFTVTLGDCHN